MMLHLPLWSGAVVMSACVPEWVRFKIYMRVSILKHVLLPLRLLWQVGGLEVRLQEPRVVLAER